jgi:amidohydrolase
LDKAILKERAGAYVDSIKDELIALSLRIHEKPETSFQEFSAQQNLTAFLTKHGLAVENGTAGMATAFKAAFTGHKEKPLIAFLGEYDALPQLGHACGHNIIGSAAAGAGAALASLGKDLPGAIWVLGTPAEEGGGGKIPMVEQGLFKDVAAVMMMHPTTGESLMGGTSTATYSFMIEYKGKPAHAAGSPHQGINALDAASIFLHAVALVRQHVPEEVRMHGLITRCGEAVNIIPEFSEVRYLMRANSRQVLDTVVEKVRACIQAGAIATGCSVTISEKRGYDATLPNATITNVLRENYGAAGIPMKQLPRTGKGSTDLGNVSQVVPQACGYPAIAPATVAGHSREMCAASASPEGHKVLIASAKALAWAAIDLMDNPATLDSAWAEFREKTAK